MSYITIDQSFTQTAWIIWENHQVKEFGVVSSDPSQTKYARAEFIATEILKVVKEYKPDKMIIEQIAYGGVGNAAKDLCGLLYTIIIACKRGSHLTYQDVVFVTATGAKKSHTGDGRADKKKMFEYTPDDIKTRFLSKHLKTKGVYDLCDAYAFGIWYQKQ